MQLWLYLPRCIAASLRSLESTEKFTYRLQTGVERGTLHDQIWNENVRQVFKYIPSRRKIGDSKDDWEIMLNG